MEILSPIGFDDDENDTNILIESDLEEATNMVIQNTSSQIEVEEIVTKLEMPSRKMKVNVNGDLLDALKQMNLKFVLN